MFRWQTIFEVYDWRMAGWLRCLETTGSTTGRAAFWLLPAVPTQRGVRRLVLAGFADDFRRNLINRMNYRPQHTR